MRVPGELQVEAGFGGGRRTAGLMRKQDGRRHASWRTFQRADGSTQATYNGWPLYYWKGDTNAGDVSGQNVSGVWFVLDHDGNPIKK